MKLIIFNTFLNLQPLDWNLLGVAGTDIPIEELKILMIAQRVCTLKKIIL